MILECLCIALIGDSITGTLFSYANQEYPGYELQNIAYRGTTSADWLVWGAPFPADPAIVGALHRFLLVDCADGDPPDAVQIMLGGNDAVGRKEPAPIDAERFHLHLSVLINHVRNFWPGAEIWLANPPQQYVTEGTIVNGDHMTLLAAYHESIDRLIAENDDVYPGLDSRNAKLYPSDYFDGVHPWISGVEKMTAEFQRVLDGFRSRHDGQ